MLLRLCVMLPKGQIDSPSICPGGILVATLLYRLGRLSYRRRWRVPLLWVVVLGLLGVGAATLSGPTTNAFNIPGTESTKALAVLSRSYVELKILPLEPDMSKLYTEEFLPKK